MSQPSSHGLHLPTGGAGSAGAPGAPTQSQPAFPMPAAKRARISPGPGSQPQSPYSAVSPGSATTPTGATSIASPTMSNAGGGHGIALPTPTNSMGSYTNGQPQQQLALPDTHPPLPASTALYTTASMAPIVPNASFSMLSPSPATPGAMGPPSRPPERPTKEPDYEPDDMLAGTGIDLRAEEQFQADMLYGSEARQGFPQYPLGDKSSFYGAGPMNQPPTPVNGLSQAEFMVTTAEKAWKDASYRLAVSRSTEISNAFVGIGNLHARAQRIAKENGLGLHEDAKKDATAPHGRMRMPDDQSQPTVTIQTKTLDDGAVVNTYGSIIPQDAYLVDQFALISIACKQRLKALLEDALRVTENRQATSHGDIPAEWSDVAAPPKGPEEVVVAQQGTAPQDVEMAVPDSAVSPRTNPLKHPLDNANTDPTAPPPKIQRIDKNLTVETMRDVGKSERDWEELRLRRRNARKDGASDPTASRAGSVAPGTPTSGTTESGARKESMSKKEQRKSAAAKAIDASMSQASQNQTSSLFLGKSRGLFGKKAYGWMNKGGASGSRSGTSTPARPGTPGPAQAVGESTVPAEAAPLTGEGRNRLGLWREDKEKARNIQLRDWIAAVESERLKEPDARTLQSAYDKLDASGPR